MIYLLLYLMTPPQNAPLLRVTYQVEIFEGNRQVTARLVLNRLEKNQFSIHCSKAPSGTLFTYWATVAQNTLYLPKSQLAFVGDAAEPFSLFPNGPSLGREAWVNVLFAEPGTLGGGFTVADEAGWRILRHREKALTIRWREQKRGQRDTYSSRTLNPELGAEVHIEALDRIPFYWED